MSAHPKVGAGQHGALLLELDGPVVEQPAQPTASQIFGGGGVPHEYRLRDVVQALRAAAKDNRVPAVVLDLDIFSGGGQTALSRGRRGAGRGAQGGQASACLCQRL